MDLIRELNYDCNASIFKIALAVKTNLTHKEDRNRVTLWIQKIMKSDKTLTDLKVRNLFLVCLSKNVLEKKLKAPFNQDPPRAALRTLTDQLAITEDSSSQDEEIMEMLRFLPAKHGGFLLPKPLPQIGAYCYIAAYEDECGPKPTA